MSAKWAGIGPAVDAHLQRWAQAEREVLLAEQYYRPHSPMNAQIARDLLSKPWLHAWIQFGASYGFVGPDGNPIIMGGLADGQTIVGREQFSGDDTAIRQGLHLAVREHKMLDRAVSHYVSAEVLDEIDEAAELAVPDVLHETDLFAQDGFAVFERAVVFPDLDPRSGLPHPTLRVHIRAIGWCREPNILSQVDDTVRAGVSIFFYTTREDFAEGYYATAKAAGMDIFDPSTVRDGFLPVEVLPWSFDVPWTMREQSEYVPGTVPYPVGFQRRWFYVFMRLMWQQIIVRRAGHPHRHELRRWERLAKRKALLDYTVLRLRRVVDPGYKPTGIGVPLEYRQLVRKHWSYQYYPSLGGPARMANGEMDPLNHRWVLIEPYWRGPDDGEIGPMHPATSFVR